MKIGIFIPLTDWLGNIAPIAQKTEALGFESIWLPEHVFIPVHTASPYGGSADGKIPETMPHTVSPFIALASASGATSTIKLGTGVCLVPQHHVLDLAWQVATLDMYCGGRFLFGIGSGWLREEGEIYGVDWEHRGAHLRESMLAMKELWTKEEAEYHGKYIDFPLLRANPKPTQKPHPPIIVGGTAPSVFRRVVGWGNGWMPTGPVELEVIRRGRETIDRLATEAGRDPESIDITSFNLPADPELAKRYEEANVDRWVVRLIPSGEPHSPQAALDALDNVAEKMLG